MKLHPAIWKALTKHNFTEPTDPQIKAIPAVLDGANILLIASTMSVRARTIVVLGPGMNSLTTVFNKSGSRTTG